MNRERENITPNERVQIAELLQAATAPQRELTRIYDEVKKILDDDEDYHGWICDAVFGQPAVTVDELLHQISVGVQDP